VFACYYEDRTTINKPNPDAISELAFFADWFNISSFNRYIYNAFGFNIQTLRQITLSDHREFAKEVIQTDSGECTRLETWELIWTLVAVHEAIYGNSGKHQPPPS